MYNFDTKVGHFYFVWPFYGLSRCSARGNPYSGGGILGFVRMSEVVVYFFYFFYLTLCPFILFLVYIIN